MTSRSFFLVGALLLAQCVFAQQTVSPEDARRFVGSTVTVRGTVANVYTSGKGNTFLNFGAPYPRQVFTAVIFVEDAAVFGKPDLQELEGRVVAVRGTVQLYKGKPEIILHTRAQLVADK